MCQMFSTLAILVLLSFLLLLGFCLLMWSLIGFGAGPRAMPMPWRNARKSEVASANPFVRKEISGNSDSSELAPDHISRAQIRTVKKPVSDASLAEIRAITEEKAEQPDKTTTYEQMVKRAKSPTLIPSRRATPVPPAREAKPATQSPLTNDQLRGAQAKKTRIDQDPETPQDLPKSAPAAIPSPETKTDIPSVIHTPTHQPPSVPNVTHSFKDTPVANLPRKEKPLQDVSEDIPQKKLWPAPLSPMVPKPAIYQEKPLVPQPFQPSEADTLKPQAVPKTQSRSIGKTSADPFEKFSKDKKDDTLF